MNYNDIELFLNLVNTRNISKSAEEMFIAQSVISTRLKRLEEELGCELLVRGKGMREVTFTPAGKDFIGIATRWKNLYEEAERIKDRSTHKLRIACPESVFYDFLDPVITKILMQHPLIRCSVRIEDSAGVYDKMECNEIDYGFASYESSRSGILHSHLYDQHYSVVSYTEFPTDDGMLSPDMLDSLKEVRLSGGNFSSLVIWRDKWFPDHAGGRVEINSPHMMVSLLKDAGAWAVLPQTSAANMATLYGMKNYILSDPPESRKIYFLRRNGAKSYDSEASAIFEKEIGTYITDKK